ncbi:hypothetical protein KAFR_0A03760 [Kazachstania africana CBS 2517]|uniref:Dihydrofolate reductase n=1 Tax=Kazachstania africana (strain ATCC 22294 / BCRC 22015 / CBS 2517 / CECT 1963 / NBRC 1671 / NRRL Y-8276) TaxID=1071382 RepID=H2AN61_KAZAF|nr:hypothetical protein KAFR_0A03760 [Kazachstania africana CBS 2517]CCF55811.1 hypothetical protein KAFR_0A03760 [Kazachstania africana CBS 2517]
MACAAPKHVPVVSIVAALLPDMGIGFQQSLPWRLSKEMKYFREVTSSTFDGGKQNAVIMGRKTWESIPSRFRPLPNRINVVLSRSFENGQMKQVSLDENKTYFQSSSLQRSIDSLMSLMGEKLERIYIIGGSEIYNHAFDVIDHVLITKLEPVDTVRPKMDTFLDVAKLNDSFQEMNQNLADFLPPNVTLPKPHNQAYIENENGYKFEFSLYSRK